MGKPTIQFKGKPLHVVGRDLSVGDSLPAFRLSGNDLSDVTPETFAGKKIILSVVPSLDTPVCAIQTKRFNEEAGSLGNDVAILTVSLDLPFAQKRWCGAEGVERVITASDYKYRAFGEDFGVYIQELGLLARAIFVVDKAGKIVHAEYVSDISSEPNYEAALSAVKSAQ